MYTCPRCPGPVTLAVSYTDAAFDIHIRNVHTHGEVLLSYYIIQEEP